MVSTWCLEFRSTSLGSGPFSGEPGTSSRHDGSSAESAHDRTYKPAVATHENQQSSPRPRWRAVDADGRRIGRGSS